MTLRRPLIFSALVLALMLCASAWGWQVLPDNVRIAVHWGAGFRPNGFAGKPEGLLLLPGVALAITALMASLPLIEPRRSNLVSSRKLYFAGWYGTLALLLLVHALTIAYAAGVGVDVPRILLTAIALLLVLVGNFLGKSRSNFFVGVRLPWTLSSERAWTAANRFAGRGFVVTGLAAIAALVWKGAPAGIVVIGAGLVVTVVGSVIVSFVTWKNDEHRNHIGGAADEG